MKPFNLGDVHSILTNRGVNAVIFHTGGGHWTLFAGQPNTEGDYPYAVGPATQDADGAILATPGDTYGGPADEGENTPVLFTDDHTVEDIADLIEAAVQGKVTFQSSDHQVSPEPYIRP